MLYRASTQEPGCVQICCCNVWHRFSYPVSTQWENSILVICFLKVFLGWNQLRPQGWAWDSSRPGMGSFTAFASVWVGSCGQGPEAEILSKSFPQSPFCQDSTEGKSGLTPSETPTRRASSHACRCHGPKSCTHAETGAPVPFNSCNSAHETPHQASLSR